MSTTPYPLDHYDHNKAMTSILYEIPTIYLPKYFSILDIWKYYKALTGMKINLLDSHAGGWSLLESFRWIKKPIIEIKIFEK